MILYFAPVPGNSESGLLQQYFFSVLGCGQKCQKCSQSLGTEIAALLSLLI